MKTVLWLGVLLATLKVNAQSSWTQMAPCPADGRFWATAIGFDGKGYGGLGKPEFGSLTSLGDFWAYDPSTDSWTQKADFPGGPREGATAFATESRMFVGFGTPFIQFTKTLWEYLPETDTWEQMPDVPGIGFAYSHGFVLGDTLYIGPENGTNLFYAFDTSTETWTQKAPFPGVDRRAQASFALNGKGYIGSGAFVFGGSLDDWWAYDPSTNSWEEVTHNMPQTDQSSATATETQGYFFNVGGCSGGCKDLYRFEPSQNTFIFDSTKPMERISNGNMITINNLPYLVFGELTASGGNTSSNQLWRILPGSPLDVNSAEELANTGTIRYFQNGEIRLVFEKPIPAESTLRIVDMSGRLLSEITIHAGTTNVQDLELFMTSAGMYIVQLESDLVRKSFKAVKM